MIIITGVTGFIGKSLIKKLVKKYPKDEIVCLVKNDAPVYEKEGFNLLKKLKLKYILIDLKTGEGLPDFETQPELVIHMAANTHTDEKDHSVNYKGTENLVRSLKKIGPKTHFIYFGTTAIMAGRKDCSKPFDETAKPFPTNEYGRTKLKSEKYLYKIAKKLKFRLTIVRLPTVYGKDARPDSFFDFIARLVNENSILVRLNWPGKTSLIYVEDVTDAVMSISKKPPAPGISRLLILASDSPSMSTIIATVYEVLGKNYRAINFPPFFWRWCSSARIVIFRLEKIFPPNIYNLLWRSSLVVDNVIYCKSSKTPKVLPGWKPSNIDNRIKTSLI